MHFTPSLQSAFYTDGIKNQIVFNIKFQVVLVTLQYNGTTHLSSYSTNNEAPICTVCFVYVGSQLVIIIHKWNFLLLRSALSETTVNYHTNVF